MSFLIELAEDGNRAVECSRRDSSSFLNDHNYDNCNFLHLLLKHRLIHCWQLRVRGKLNVIILWDIYDQHSLLSSWVLRIHSMSLNSCALSQSRPGKLPTNVRNNFRGALRPLWQDELVIRRRRRSTKIDENWGWTIHIGSERRKLEIGNKEERTATDTEKKRQWTDEWIGHIARRIFFVSAQAVSVLIYLLNFYGTRTMLLPEMVRLSRDGIARQQSDFNLHTFSIWLVENCRYEGDATCV